MSPYAWGQHYRVPPTQPKPDKDNQSISPTISHLAQIQISIIEEVSKEKYTSSQEVNLDSQGAKNVFPSIS